MSENQHMNGQFCWNELITSDVNKAKSFYGELFNWEFSEIPMPNGSAYTIAKQGDKDICGIMETPQGLTIPPAWLSYIAVDDIQKEFERAKNSGATVQCEITEIPSVGSLCVLADPTEAVFAFWQKA